MNSSSMSTNRTAPESRYRVLPYSPASLTRSIAAGSPSRSRTREMSTRTLCSRVRRLGPGSPRCPQDLLRAQPLARAAEQLDDERLQRAAALSETSRLSAQGVRGRVDHQRQALAVPRELRAPHAVHAVRRRHVDERLRRVDDAPAPPRDPGPAATWPPSPTATGTSAATWAAATAAWAPRPPPRRSPLREPHDAAVAGLERHAPGRQARLPVPGTPSRACRR